MRKYLCIDNIQQRPVLAQTHQYLRKRSFMNIVKIVMNKRSLKIKLVKKNRTQYKESKWNIQMWNKKNQAI